MLEHYHNPAMKGSNNPRWNGGTSQYPNHYLMKINRKIKIREAKRKCSICGLQRAHLEVHHLDGGKTNHSLNNLVVVCHKCHQKYHIGRKNKTSKFRNLYGLTLQEITDKYGGNPPYFYRLHLQCALSKFLKSPHHIRKFPPYIDWIKLYGIKVRDIMIRFNIKQYALYKLHYKGKLKSFLKKNGVRQ